MTFEEKIMKNCLTLAKKGKVLPNPMVGCIIMKDGKVIGKGYHKQFGGPHAEVNAVNDAKMNGYNLKGAALFVNLEPCSHYGKTPPCTDLIIKEQIKEVVVGMTDPNPLVAGKGIRKLRGKGIKVTTGVLESQCRELNRVFTTVITQKRPYIILKTAQSIDGKIALDNFSSKWITNIKSRKLAHELRSICDGILIGRNTAEKDNPELTARLNRRPKNPVRIVIDKDLKLGKGLKIFTDKASRTIIIHSSKHKGFRKYPGAEYIGVRENKYALDLNDLCRKLIKEKIYSLLIEGGSKTLSGFVKEGLFDEVYAFVAPKIIGRGISPYQDFKLDRITKAKELILNKVIRLDNDIVLNYKNK
ncbi:MAG: bifunctional diaminohydroxyphosphoribosylaminopyrimidine deaminase/5-amino-6-(5-phosphoribosylamino)uracil reductase RibD [Bacteroidetes bacterium]|nr:bifunctional diaminohydroxyphosphoribosylaminopyrimidine deaminase/5-amino-6-(5-phosphoribosylamino)uracil reductase RibD [Bacteroidota bacterium]